MIVPLEALKAPLLAKLATIPKLSEVEALAPLPTDKLLKVKFPGLTIELEVPVIVIVPDVGARVFPLLTVKAPLTEKSAVG